MKLSVKGLLVYISDIIKIIWERVGLVINEILGVKALMFFFYYYSSRHKDLKAFIQAQVAHGAGD